MFLPKEDNAFEVAVDYPVCYESGLPYFSDRKYCEHVKFDKEGYPYCNKDIKAVVEKIKKDSGSKPKKQKETGEKISKKKEVTEKAPTKQKEVKEKPVTLKSKLLNFADEDDI